MPDYIYLLENRLSPAQRNALQLVRDSARDAGMTVFLAGGAVRDLTSGSSVRDLDFTVQGNALKLLKKLEKSGATLWGEHEPSRTLNLWFPGSVRAEISSARREEYPKPGKPVYHWATIHEDLRRRDFTANAMALSLNESSYGLLLDPLNGVADIEARLLRLAGNYGFLEDPSRLVRAWRLHQRLGWALEERTLVRYQNAREEGVISSISHHLLGVELEAIGHEEDGLGALKALEAEGWMKHLCTSWTSAKADTQALTALYQTLTQLQIQGVNPDPSAAQMELLTVKMPPKDLASLKKTIANPGFVEQWNRLEADAKEFARILTGKETAAASATWKLLTSYQAEPILWLAFTSKSAPVQAKFKNFFSVWPEAKQKIPAALLLEMRITAELPGYDELLKEIFFQLIDGKLQTEEEMRAFLEPHSPPAPPPPVNVRRSRGRRAERMKVEEEEADEIDHSDDVDQHHDSDEDEDSHSGREDGPSSPLMKPVSSAALKPAANTVKVAAPAVRVAAPAVKKETSAKAAPIAAIPAPKPVKPAPPVKEAAKQQSKPALKKPVEMTQKKAAKPVIHPAAKAAKKAPKPAPKKTAPAKSKPVSKAVPPKKQSGKPALKSAAKAVSKGKPLSKTKPAKTVHKKPVAAKKKR